MPLVLVLVKFDLLLRNLDLTLVYLHSHLLLQPPAPEPLTPIVMAGLAGSHLGLAYALRHSSWLGVGLASITVGSLLAFDIQALNHELCHQRSPSLATAWQALHKGSWTAARTVVELLLCNKYTSTVGSCTLLSRPLRHVWLACATLTSVAQSCEYSCSMC